MKNAKYILLLASWLLTACSGTAKNAQVQQPAVETQELMPNVTQNTQVQGLWGKIDDSIVEETFEQHFNAFLECYQREALEVLEEIEGTLSVYLIVGPDGSVTDEVYFEDGTLGSDAAQSCLIGKIRRIRFPEPIGGNKAKVRYSFPFEEPYGHAAPLDWSDDENFFNHLEKNRAEIDNCLQGQSGITFVIYIGRGGRVEAAGGSAGTKSGYAAASCIARAAKSWRFMNPGKRRPAKAIVQF